MASRGAKGKYEDWLTPDGLLLIRGWARDGLTDAQIWARMGIGKTLFYRIKREYADFANAIKKGRRPVIEEIEDALYKSATGYDVEEVTEEIIDDGKTKKKHIRRVTRHIPPNPASAIFALKNMKKWKFKDKPTDDAVKIGDAQSEDALSASLRELAEGMESDKP